MKKYKLIPTLILLILTCYTIRAEELEGIGHEDHTPPAGAGAETKTADIRDSYIFTADTSKIRDDLRREVTVEIKLSQNKYFFDENIVVTSIIHNNKNRDIILSLSPKMMTAGREYAISALVDLEDKRIIVGAKQSVTIDKNLGFFKLAPGNNKLALSWYYSYVDEVNHGDGGMDAWCKLPIQKKFRFESRISNLVNVEIEDADAQDLEQLKGAVLDESIDWRDRESLINVIAHSIHRKEFVPVLLSALSAKEQPIRLRAAQILSGMGETQLLMERLKAYEDSE